MKSLSKANHEKNAKAVLSLFIILVAFGIFMLFINYKDNIIANGSLQGFLTMSILAGGFLIGLLYLANKPHYTYSASKTVYKKPVKSSRTKKKKTRRK